MRCGINYYDTYSSVVGYDTLRAMLTISAVTGDKISQADIGNAYVASSPAEGTIVYCTQAPGLEEADPKDYVYKMNRNLYGVPFSGRTFQLVLEKFMDSLGFKRCGSDKCVYIKSVNDHRIIVLTYVADLINMTNSDTFRQRFNKVTFNDECKWILNMKVNRGVSQDGTAWIELTQQLAITKIAKASGVVDTRKCKALTVAGQILFATKEGDYPPTEK